MNTAVLKQEGEQLYNYRGWSLTTPHYDCRVTGYLEVAKNNRRFGALHSINNEHVHSGLGVTAVSYTHLTLPTNREV